MPCLNEEKTIAHVIRETKLVLKKLNLESIIVIIDDASTDDSVIMAKKADIIIKLKKQVRVAEVVKRGLQEALKHRPDLIIHIDADGQHDPKDIKKMYRLIKENQVDFVIGSRFKKNTEMDFFRKTGNVFFTRIVNKITGKNFTDTQSGLRILKTEIIKKISFQSSYTYTQEEIIKAHKLGYRIKEINIKSRKRKHGKSKISPVKYFFCVSRDLIKITRNL